MHPLINGLLDHDAQIITLSVIYNKLPDHLKEIDSFKVFKKKLKLFLLLHTFYSVEEFLSSWLYSYKYKFG